MNECERQRANSYFERQRKVTRGFNSYSTTTAQDSHRNNNSNSNFVQKLQNGNKEITEIFTAVHKLLNRETTAVILYMTELLLQGC